MSPLQIASLIFTVAAPMLVWSFDRRPRTKYLTRICERGLAAALIAAYLVELSLKVPEHTFDLADALPMQLCDWALFLTAAALWWRWRPGFDVAYFWGLAGTLQALFTPALDSNVTWLRKGGFFFAHAGIVAGVLHLVLTGHFRPEWPRSIIRLVIASETYLVVALAVNALTGADYGFLSHPPPQHSMLDLFSTSHWLYLVEINLIAYVFFAVLYLPWAIADLFRAREKTS